jgi:hypothetical protein
MLIGYGICAPPAQAAYTVAVEQVGGNVLATGAGSINFTALAFYGDLIDPSLISASDGAVIVGPTTPTDDTYYSGTPGRPSPLEPEGNFSPTAAAA